MPGLEYTRSLSRNGFSQVTAVFDDKIDIYFARQQVNERLAEAKQSLPPGAEPRMGPISTGLGEIYMWTVEYNRPARAQRAGRQARLAKRRQRISRPKVERLTNELERAAYLRTVQDWIIRPQLKSVPGVADVDAIGGYVKQYHVQPDPAKLLAAYGLSSRHRTRLERNNLSRGQLPSSTTARLRRTRHRPNSRLPTRSPTIVVGTRAGVPITCQDVADVRSARELAPAAAARTATRSSSARR